MSTLSRQVANRIQTTEHVKASVTAHGDDIARAVAAQSPELNKSDVRKLIGAMLAQLEDATEALRAAELAYTAEQADDPQPRDARDHKASALAERFAWARELVRSTLGAPAVQQYALHGNVPRAPADLAGATENAISLLRTFPANPTASPVITLDTHALADDLQQHLDALRDALAATGREDRELQTARLARDVAIERWSQVYPGVGALLEGLYRIAGQTELAARIRPTRRRTSGHTAAIDELEDESGSSGTHPPVSSPQDAELPEPV